MAAERSPAWRWAWRGLLGIGLLGFVAVFRGGIGPAVPEPAPLHHARERRGAHLRRGLVRNQPRRLHRECGGRILHRIVRIVFPRFRQGTPGLVRLTTSQPTLVLWLREEPGLATNRTAPIRLTTRLKDDQGVAAGEGSWLTLGPLGFGPPGVMQQDFKVLPRRSRTLALEFATRGPDGTSGAGGNPRAAQPCLHQPAAVHCRTVAVVPDQRRRRMPPGSIGLWDRQFLPSLDQPRRHRDLLRITGSTGRGSPGDRRVPISRTRYEHHPLDHRLAAHQRRRGQRGQAGSSSSGTVADALAFTFGPVPWPGEPWRLDLWAKRTAAAPFAPDELVSLRDIELPPPGRTNQLDHAASPGGIALVVKGFADASRRAQRLLLAGSFPALDRSGRPARGRLRGSRPSRRRPRPPPHLGDDLDDTRHPLKLEFGFREVPEDAQRVSVTLAVHRGRTFSFVVQPQVVGTNGFEYTFSPASAR